MPHYSMMLAFIEGLGLIVQPCIIPILPFILSYGLAMDKYRPYGIMFGFVSTFILSTLLLRQTLDLTGLDPDWITRSAYLLLFMFGMTMLFDSLGLIFYSMMNKFTFRIQNSRLLNRKSEGFFNGFLFGVLISFVWVPCAGPILASVIVQVATSQTDLYSYFILFSFSVGCAIPMLIMIIFGKRFITKINYLKRHSIGLRKGLGVIIMISAILFGYTDIIQYL